MRFTHSEAEEMLRSLCREFVDRHAPMAVVREADERSGGFIPALWQAFGEQQLSGLMVDPVNGGVGATYTELALVAEELGHGLVPIPFTATAVAAVQLLQGAASGERWLRAIAAGEVVVSPALLEADGTLAADRIAVTAERDGDGWRLNGVKWYVPYADAADAFVVLARTGSGAGELGLFLVPAQTAGVSRAALPTLGLPAHGQVAFAGVRLDAASAITAADEGWSVLQRSLPAINLSLAAEMLGAMHRVLEHVTAYATERVQFGRPIGSFQAVSHRLADIAVDVASTRVLVERAAWSLDSGQPAEGACSAARAMASRAYRKATHEAHQVLAGHGFVMENDLQLFFRHAPCVELGFGSLAENWLAYAAALHFPQLC